ncbi:MAG: hypothetical protein R2932_16785 [Caldilineaceae bacterium]
MTNNEIFDEFRGASSAVAKIRGITTRLGNYGGLWRSNPLDHHNGIDQLCLPK